jgi:hypothetical protein
MSIRKNIGTADRTARIILGLIILLVIPLAFVGPRTPLAFLGFLGIIPLLAGISGYCPPYALLGINTHRKEKTAI